MPHLLRFSHDIENRLMRLAELTGQSKAELIEHLVTRGLAELESELLCETPSPRLKPEPAIDQRLRESGLGA